MARVLVAEDEASLAQLVKINLEDDGHEVQVVEDGRYALRAMMKDGPFDVVVTDLMMPWCDGFDFLRALGSKIHYTHRCYDGRLWPKQRSPGAVRTTPAGIPTLFPRLSWRITPQ